MRTTIDSMEGVVDLGHIDGMVDVDPGPFLYADEGQSVVSVDIVTLDPAAYREFSRALAEETDNMVDLEDGLFNWREALQTDTARDQAFAVKMALDQDDARGLGPISTRQERALYVLCALAANSLGYDGYREVTVPLEEWAKFAWSVRDRNRIPYFVGCSPVVMEDGDEMVLMLPWYRVVRTKG